MPYAKNDAWHRDMREFEKNLGKVRHKTVLVYRRWFEEAYQIVGEGKSPADLTKEDLRKLELETHGNENSLAIKLRQVRYFLRCSGCKAAQQWRITFQTRPSVKGVFLKEPQVLECRKIAEMLGVEHALIFTLTMDMGLRPVDMLNLTVTNAEQFMYAGGSVILGKGKNGGKLAYQATNPISVQPLVEYLRHRNQLIKQSGMVSDYLLLRRDNRWKKQFLLRRMSYDDIWALYADLREATKIPFTPKDGRKTCGNRLSYVVDLPTAATCLRHENPNTTFKHYIGRTADDLASAMSKLNPSTPIQSNVTRQ
jgi:integrase